MSSPSAFMSAELEPKKRTEGVLSRFKHAIHTGNASHSNGLPVLNDHTLAQPIIEPKSLKIRFITWNMHESLPKGDLEELLGRVPLYNPSNSKSDSFPCLPDDENHPFHLVLIAGQECPTPSGIPMGLTAGLKLYDREKDDNEKAKDGDGDSSDEDKDEPEKLTGWTQIVEDWLCHGGGSTRSITPATAAISPPKPLVRQKTNKEPRRGPYQLLVKDRLMGIYLALYIHRELKPLVRGTSKSSVTAGLIGGRLGNKGGVGISLNLDGTTFLFLNAHLAAHEGRVQHRLANFVKIKNELEVDAFLPSDDPRNTAEDITEKFDFTFLCGDLNFRLDISRLHADWLIAKQEYAKAFAFDQLAAVMKKKGGEFEGFHEAPIDFPPTFKYDVLKTLKRPKRANSKASHLGDDPQAAEAERRKSTERPDDYDMLSDAGSSISSIHSRVSEVEQQDEDYFCQTQTAGSPAPLTTTPTIITSSSKVSVNTNGSGLTKAKAKWMSILSPSFVTSPKLLKVRHAESWGGPMSPSTPNSAAFPPTPLSAATPTLGTPQTAATATGVSVPTPAQKRKFLRPPPMVLINSSAASQNGVVDEANGEKLVYDTSSKKRVPSWCDRVLWKTTIPKPEPTPIESDDSSSHKHLKSRNLGQRFAEALRSPSRHAKDAKSPPSVSHDLFPSSAGIPQVTRVDPRPPMTAAPNVAFKQPDPRHTRRTQTDYSPPPTAPALRHATSPRRSTVASPGSPERPTSASSSIWRFFNPFFSPTQPSSTSRELSALTPAPPLHVRGDVTTAMQGFNKYYPPDYDPNQGSLNKVRGKHALGDRARKLDQGILITRFELPFNIWCGTCNNHIGMGVRYNAEKKKVGNYFSTPIYSFRCKCHLCDGWFEIQTDPKNTRYVVTSGARQKIEDWDPEENGGFAIHDTDKDPAAALDPLATLEKTTDAKKLVENVQKPRIESLQNASEYYNSDPYSLSLKARKRFREEKKVEQKMRHADDELKGRYGLPTNLSLVKDDEKAVQEAKAQWQAAKEEQAARDTKRRRISASGSSKSSLASSSNPVDSLRAKILKNTAKSSTSMSSGMKVRGT